MELLRKSREVEELNRQLMKYLGKQSPQALKIIGQIKELGERKGDTALIGYAYYRYAYFYYFIKRDLKKFRKNIQNAVHHLLRSGDREFLGGTYNLIAYDALDLGCYDIAYAYYMLAVKACENEKDIPLPGLIEASAGRLLIELGEYKRGQRQQKHALKRFLDFKDMYVYNYNVILTYADIALSAFLLEDLPEIERTLERAKEHFDNATKDEATLSRSYYLLMQVYRALLAGDDDALEEQFGELLRYWRKLPASELFGLIFEIESLCHYMLAHDYIRQAALLLETAVPVQDDENLSIGLRYYTLRIAYYEKTHDLEKLRSCLHMQHILQKQENDNLLRRTRYSMEFSDLLERILIEREKAKEDNVHLQMQADTDALTGLPNRAVMTRFLGQKYEEAIAEKSNFGIGILDIDEFKKYNDTHGHQAGDLCLQVVGKVLLSYNENPKLFCTRYGGDEFVIGYFGMTTQQINKIKQAMNEDIMRESAKLENGGVSVSQGSCNAVPDSRKKMWDYLLTADKKLYKIKKEKTASR